MRKRFDNFFGTSYTSTQNLNAQKDYVTVAQDDFLSTEKIVRYDLINFKFKKYSI